MTPSAYFLVRYRVRGIEHARTVEACCEGAAVEAARRFVRIGHGWHVRQLDRDPKVIDIGGGAGVCPAGCRHETE